MLGDCQWGLSMGKAKKREISRLSANTHSELAYTISSPLCSGGSMKSLEESTRFTKFTRLRLDNDVSDVPLIWCAKFIKIVLCVEC